MRFFEICMDESLGSDSMAVIDRADTDLGRHFVELAGSVRKKKGWRAKEGEEFKKPDGS